MEAPLPCGAVQLACIVIGRPPAQGPRSSAWGLALPLRALTDGHHTTSAAWTRPRQLQFGSVECAPVCRLRDQLFVTRSFRSLEWTLAGSTGPVEWMEFPCSPVPSLPAHFLFSSPPSRVCALISLTPAPCRLVCSSLLLSCRSLVRPRVPLPQPPTSACHYYLTASHLTGPLYFSLHFLKFL